MEIAFVRHTEKESIGEDPSLTKKGVKQAKHLSFKLKETKFKGFYCSEMNRAKQTAKIISKKIKKIPKEEKSLNEFESEIMKKNKSRWTKKERGHYNELISFLKKISKDPNADTSILIVAHGITNRIILSHFIGLKLKGLIQFRQSNGGINSVYWTEKFKNWRLKIWNDNTHIPKKIRYSKASY